MKLVETSILIPTFDNGKYLLECLGSILRQEYQDYEIIIVDDYSNDNTETIITTLAILDPRIKYFKNIKKKGLVPALNYGISLCNGEFIARMDADDMMMGNRLYEQINYLKENHTVHCVCSGLQLMDQNGFLLNKSYGNTDIEESRFVHLFCNMYVHASMTVRKKVFKDFKYNEDYLLCEDYELWSRVNRKYRIKHLPEIHHCYRIYEHHNKSKEIINKRQISVLKILSAQLDYYQISHDDKEILLHYSLFHTKELIGSDEEINNWLNKVFESNRINQLFDKELLSKLKKQIYTKFQLNF